MWKNPLEDRFLEAREPEVLEPMQGDSLELLQAVYRDPAASLGVRMRAAIAALPFERPKLQVVATVSHVDLAARLEARRCRLAQPKVIDHEPMASVAEPPKAVTPAGAPFARVRRG